MNINSQGENEKTVVLVNRAVFLPGEGGYKRTVYLFNMMRRLGHRPILLTSDFNHYKKEVRDTELFYQNYPDYSNQDIVFLHTRPYSKNISLQRRLAEDDWRKGVAKWVKDNCDRIDTIMMSMPDMNTILAVANVCSGKNIEIVIDVRDLRPEAFKVLLKNELLYKVCTFPMKQKADRAYACADKLFAVSEEYLERGSVKGSHASYKKAIYIGAVLEKFDAGVAKFSGEIDKPEDELWLTYAGTLGTSYDMITAIDAVARLKDRTFGGKRLRFMILGQGPDREAFEAHARAVGADNVTFVGFVDYEKMAAYLSKSDFTLNAVKRRGSQSIINKVADYFAAGIPMLNGCVCKEQQDMVDRYAVGLNYEPEDVDSLAHAIELLAEDPERCAEMGRNARKLALDKFDRKTTYQEIIDQLYQ